MLKLDRRNFIAGSGAIAVLGITGASGAPSRNIGFVISTTVHGDHIFSFLQALEDNGFTIDGNHVQFFPGSAHGKYGGTHQEIHDHAKTHADNGVDLIVAAGGLVSAAAVAQAIDEHDKTRGKSAKTKFV